MWRKVINIPIMARAKIVEAGRSLKTDERGLSGVVVAILLILVAVLAVVIIWGFLSGYLEQLWEQIIGNTIA